MKHVKRVKHSKHKGKARKDLKIHGGFKATEHKTRRKR